MFNNIPIQFQSEKNREIGLPISLSCGNISSISLDDMRKIYRMNEYADILSKYHFPDHPSSDGYYHVNIRDLTKKNKYRQVKARTLEDLAMKVIDIEVGIDLHLRSLTFRIVFDRVQKEKLQYVKSDERKASVLNTVHKNRAEYKRYFSETFFEDLPIDYITKQHIEQICFLNLERYNMRDKAFSSLRGILMSVFKYAHNERWIGDNPYTRVNFAKFKDMVLPSAKPEDRMYSEEDVQRFLEYIRSYEKEHPSYWPAYALELQILMGARRAEVPPLTWDDVKETHIDICKELLTVYPDGGGKQILKIVGHTKTNKARKFPLTSEIKDFLARLKKAHDNHDIQSERLFPGEGVTGTVTNAQVYGYYRRVCRALNIEVDPNIKQGPHSFRRNGITRVMNMTGNVVLASQLYGNSPEVASKHYYGGIDIEAAAQVLESITSTITDNSE